MTLFHSFDALTDTKGNSLAGYQVIVRGPGSGPVQPIYADTNMTPIYSVSGIVNTALTDNAGNWSLFVQPGTYDLEFRDPNGTYLRTVPGVTLFTGQTGAPGAPGLDGTDGQTGPANSTYPTLALFKAADTTNLSANYDGSLWFFSTGNFTGLTDDVLIVAANSVPTTVGAWVRQYTEIDPAWFGAIGDASQTGAGADDTAAVQAALDKGGIINLPVTSIYKCGPLKITKDGTVLRGFGGIAFTSGILGLAALDVIANDCTIDGVVCYNPGKVQQQTGDATFGIRLRGNRNRVLNCNVLDSQYGISVDAYGEYYENLIQGNYVRVIGAGNGPVNTTSAYGEDRGDGIADYGARTKIIGNTVQAANALFGNNANGPQIAGTDYNDCRIGIDAEDLPIGPGHTGPDDSAGTVIMGNLVIPSEDGKGRFRRCYSAEGARRSRMIGNYGRGWTWCGQWLVGSSVHALVNSNTFTSDTDPADRSGAVWGPVKAAILPYAQGGPVLENVVVSGNAIEARTTHSQGIQIYITNGSVGRNISITGNRILTTVTQGANSAFGCYGASTGIVFADNVATGSWYNGFNVENTGYVTMNGNVADGAIANGLRMDQVTSASIKAMSLLNCSTDAIALSNGDYTVDGAEFSAIGRFSLVGATGSHIRFNNNTSAIGGAQIYFNDTQLVSAKGNYGFAPFQATAAYAGATIADGAGGPPLDIPLPLCAPGDVIRVVYDQPLLGLSVTAAVKTAGTVTVIVRNWTGASVTLAAGTFTFMMERG